MDTLCILFLARFTQEQFLHIGEHNHPEQAGCAILSTPTQEMRQINHEEAFNNIAFCIPLSSFYMRSEVVLGSILHWNPARDSTDWKHEEGERDRDRGRFCLLIPTTVSDMGDSARGPSLVGQPAPQHFSQWD